MRVHLATNYEIGEKCKTFLKDNLPDYYEYTDEPEKSDVYISILSKKLIKQDFIEGRQCFNFHFGILPKWKGAGIIPQVIIAGDKEFGITLHEIDKTIDGGNIIDIRKFDILPNDTGEELFNRACENLYIFFKEYAVRLLKNQWWSGEQEEQSKIYYKKDMEKLKDITSIIRAFTFEGKENAYWIDKKGNKNYIIYE